MDSEILLAPRRFYFLDPHEIDMHPGRQAFLSSGSEEPRSALESRRVYAPLSWQLLASVHMLLNRMVCPPSRKTAR